MCRTFVVQCMVNTKQNMYWTFVDLCMVNTKQNMCKTFVDLGMVNTNRYVQYVCKPIYG